MRSVITSIPRRIRFRFMVFLCLGWGLREARLAKFVKKIVRISTLYLFSRQSLDAY